MSKPGNEEQASWAQSGMILDTLRHVMDALDYLHLLKNQSIFNFCAVPATMAMAMLKLCFMNKDIFQQKLKFMKMLQQRYILSSFLYENYSNSAVPLSDSCPKILE